MSLCFTQVYLVSEHTEVDENREIKNDIILRIQIALPRRLFLKIFIQVVRNFMAHLTFRRGKIIHLVCIF